ncbi:MAG: hypothetical protein DSM107014_08550 [Gomphosphaeria aponina SAG 52.96 = DSM 107014]|uniref:Uncharacterized protein n=1 Tax=Gomphosphaeria aponina SAG 52.96 = DSM 107014 TaxID=1521640 RepID=A0A941JPR0_9CHRO|nr:hypothetical protein [Gomphosphaeria aponina SAG 52.96 = DSM 107014]
MSIVSTCLNVEQFFNQYNWEGDELEEEVEVKEISWECLTVADFFNSHNWEGRLIVTKEEQKSDFMSLTMPVKEFLQFIVWEGGQAVDEEVQSSPKEPIYSSLKVTDLSDLF